MNSLRRSVERRPSDDSENSGSAGSSNQISRPSPLLVESIVDSRNRTLSNAEDPNFIGPPLEDAPTLVVSRCNSITDQVDAYSFPMAESFAIESISQYHGHGHGPSVTKPKENLLGWIRGSTPSPYTSQKTQITETDTPVLNIKITLTEPLKIDQVKGFDYLIIVKTYGDNAQFSGFWKIRKILDEGRIIICKERLKDSEPNTTKSYYEVCSVNEKGKPELHVFKNKPNMTYNDHWETRFPNGFVQVAPPLEFRFRSTVFSIADIENLRQSIRADIYCEFRLKRISSCKNTDFITDLLLMYGVRKEVIKFANQTEESSPSEFWSVMSEDPESDHPEIEFYDYTIKKRLQGVFIDSMELQEFPFDRENINFRIAVAVPQQLVTLVPNTLYPGYFIKSGFQLADLFDAYDKVDIVAGMTDKKMSSVDLIYPMMTITVYMDRRPWYYVFNVILPMMILTFLASVAFSDLFKTSRSDKITISLTVLFTAVAYKFVVASSLPQISYLTELDLYVNTCFGFITVLVTHIALFPTLVYAGKKVYHWVAFVFRHECTIDFTKLGDYENYEVFFAVMYVTSFVTLNACWAYNLHKRIQKREKFVTEEAPAPLPASQTGMESEAQEQLMAEE